MGSVLKEGGFMCLTPTPLLNCDVPFGHTVAFIRRLRLSALGLIIQVGLIRDILPSETVAHARQSRTRTLQPTCKQWTVSRRPFPSLRQRTSLSSSLTDALSDGDHVQPSLDLMQSDAHSPRWRKNVDAQTRSVNSGGYSRTSRIAPAHGFG